MINIFYYSANPNSPAKPYWDQALLDDILSDEVFTRIPGNNGAIIVIPGAYQADYINQINKELSKYTWVILFITSDEESKFPIEKIKHKNIKIYVQYPKQGRHDQYGKWPLGYTMETRHNLQLLTKDINVFFSGQITHPRRESWFHELFKLAKTEKHYAVQRTEGFSQGHKAEHYMQYMNEAKVAPSPAGPVSADAFRTYEALEAGAVPISDDVSNAGDHDYTQYVLGDVPFPTIKDVDNIPGYIEDTLKGFPEVNNKAQAWWIKKKRDLKQGILADIKAFTDKEDDEQVTIIIPVSPIKSHPSTAILNTTILSIRHHFPTAEIIITFDGVRKEQESKRGDYETFKRYALYRCNTDWNAIPMIFEHHTHQVGMMREALKEVKTPLVLYVEQDTPLVIDEPIEWSMLRPTITLGIANVIRLHFEGRIPEAHKHLMLGEPERGLQKTIQWSQRPHLASTKFYKFILDEYFSKDAKCFIEDKIHGVVQDHYTKLGYNGWDIWKLFIYHPNDKNIKRSLNLDGREGEEKYDDSQKF